MKGQQGREVEIRLRLFTNNSVSHLRLKRFREALGDRWTREDEETWKANNRIPELLNDVVRNLHQKDPDLWKECNCPCLDDYPFTTPAVPEPHEYCTVPTE